MAACLEAQQAFARLAAAAIATDPATSGAAQVFAAQYRRLFAQPELPAAEVDAAVTGESVRRYQRAVEQAGKLLNEAAADAGRRLGAALADNGPDAAPITTLRELQTLWIDCGEAAWSATAHRKEFAEAQAELLAAWAALCASGSTG